MGFQMNETEFKKLFINSLKNDENFKKEVFSLLSDLISENASFQVETTSASVETIGDFGGNYTSEVVEDIDGITLSFENDYVFEKLVNTEYHLKFNEILLKYYSFYKAKKSSFLFRHYCSFIVFHDIPDIKKFEKDVDALIKSSLKYTNKFENKDQIAYRILDFIKLNHKKGN